MVEHGSINDIISAYGTVVYRFPPTSTRYACVVCMSKEPPAFTHTHYNTHAITLIYSKVSPSNVLVNPSFEQVTSAGSVDGAYLSVPSDPASTYLADSRYVDSQAASTIPTIPSVSPLLQHVS